MRDRERSRRGFLGALAAGLSAVAGCSTTDATGRTTTARPCATGFEIADRRVRIERGTTPEVTLTLHNGGETPIEYEVTVRFTQGTSLGRSIRSGRDVLTGPLAPGETVTRTATDDAPEVENTSGYDLAVSVEC